VALAALALVVFSAIECPPKKFLFQEKRFVRQGKKMLCQDNIFKPPENISVSEMGTHSL